MSWEKQKTTLSWQKMQGLKLKDKIQKWKERNMATEVATLALFTERVWKCKEKKKRIVDFYFKAKVNWTSSYLPSLIKNRLANTSLSKKAASLMSVINIQSPLAKMKFVKTFQYQGNTTSIGISTFK